LRSRPRWYRLQLRSRRSSQRSLARCRRPSLAVLAPPALALVLPACPDVGFIAWDEGGASSLSHATSAPGGEEIQSARSHA